MSLERGSLLWFSAGIDIHQQSGSKLPHSKSPDYRAGCVISFQELAEPLGMQAVYDPGFQIDASQKTGEMLVYSSNVLRELGRQLMPKLRASRNVFIGV
jgi:hypothetical protein